LPGSKLVSIGNPGASTGLWIYTPGEVRSVYRKKWMASDESGKHKSNHDVRVIEATSPVNPGDSGGPCFNDKGEQVGVTEGFLPDARAFSLFIEASEAKAFLKANKVAFNGGNGAPNSEVAKKDPSR